MDIVEKIFSYYEEFGSKDYIGEDVTQIEHMIQAAMLAEENKDSTDVILGALFHDIGHLVAFDKDTMGKFGIKNHQVLGANFLRELGIPEIIPELVESHVNSKKYLARDENYYNRLSNASQTTLQFQGGIFTDKEALEYEKLPNFELYIKIRMYDDAAKDPNKKMKSLNYYKDMLYTYLNRG
jgi:2-amino-1-hydroxyethylphosphonate dioxygenase (glycine-forming)